MGTERLERPILRRLRTAVIDGVFCIAALSNGLEPLARGGAEELNYPHLRIRLLEDA
jgi:hypothetical protein